MWSTVDVRSHRIATVWRTARTAPMASTESGYPVPMVQSIIHLAVAAVLGVLAIAAWRSWARFGRSYTLIVILVAVGLTYDNAILGLGRWIGHGPALEALSLPRFVLHALSTPLLVIVGFGAARAAGIRWAQQRGPHVAACLVATALVAWGVVTDIVLLELEEQSDGGIVSYGNALGAVPVPAIATIVGLIGFGVVIWRTNGWVWTALGAAVMFVASGLGSISGLLTNVGELALIVSLVATERAAGEWSRLRSGRPAQAVREQRPDVAHTRW